MHIKYEVGVKEILTHGELVALEESPTRLEQEGLTDLPEYPVYVR